MGLPVTASYIVLIILAGPALVNEFGLPVLVAHMVVFWFSQDSNVTPPVCLAAYAAAGVAGSEPMRTGLLAWKYAKGLYLIPLLMVVHPGDRARRAADARDREGVVAMVALAAFAAALEGHALRSLRPRGAPSSWSQRPRRPSTRRSPVGAAGGVAAVAYVLWDRGRASRPERFGRRSCRNDCPTLPTARRRSAGTPARRVPTTR
jgi:hypothetical protein